ncbi:STAS domain-containing protein [Spirillospora sp. NPDC047279]|uniref:STAS domain-containing protein n=1 Tax=Spirillospora sp. NPDC047279 TaxID=3155478 RepID=UPI0034052450
MTVTATAAPTAAQESLAPADVRTPAPRRPGRTVVALNGALDVAAAPALREHLRGELAHSARLLILDLGEVVSCDATGLAVLIGTQRRATGAGVTLILAAPTPQITKLLRITRLDRVLTVHPTVDDAIAQSAVHAV